MKLWFSSVDEILRGQATTVQALRTGQIDISIRELAPVLIQMAAFYGFCMGWYAILNHDDPQYMQIWANMIKIPLLFLLTLLVTLPSLYVFNALVGSRLEMRSLLSLLAGAMAVTLAVLASFGPIIAFFSVTTTSYAFMTLFNVLLFAVAGILGLKFLAQTLHRLTVATAEEEAPPTPRMKKRFVRMAPVPATTGVAGESSVALANGLETENGIQSVAVGEPSEPSAGALEHHGTQVPQKHVKRVFLCWMVLFALVGGQMSWVLRPFIGEPGTPFQLFRARNSNFLEAVVQALANLFS